MNDSLRFKYLFWFCAGVVLLGFGLSIFAIIINPAQIVLVLTFWLSGGVGTCIGYQVGSSANKAKPPENTGTATADISATITTETKDDKK